MKENKLNLTYYKGTDNYSDGDIENTIIKYIKSGKSVDEILKKDHSWPVYYHLSSNRQNIINWYPFRKNATILEIGAGMGAITPYLCRVAKKVVSVESSKRRASAILERCKDFNNLEIMVGNFNDIKFEDKFDYITLIGVFEYALMFTDNKENAYVELLENIKKLLKPNGKILIAIENRFGLKYWCGAKEDHTNIVFDGINNYASGNQFVRTFSKADLEEIFKTVKLNCNFYYPLPDYKFPELILTDEILKENNNHVYNPYYCQPFNMFANERKLFNDILKNNELAFFANSYFVELTGKVELKDVTYAKFNGYRRSSYALITYKKNERYYKRALYKEGTDHISNIVKYTGILKNHGINYVPVYIEGNECYTEKCKTTYSLMDKLIGLFKLNKISEISVEIDKYVKYLYDHFDTIDVIDQKTIFDKYNVKISKTQRDKLHFVKDGFIDLCFQNIILDNDKYVLIDQEWYDEYVPIEFLIYRSIHLLVFDGLCFKKIEDAKAFFDVLIEKYHINGDILKLFGKLNILFMASVVNDISFRKVHELYMSYGIDISFDVDSRIYDYNDNARMISQLKECVKNMENVIEDDKNRIDILQSDCDKMNNNLQSLSAENLKLSIELSKIYNSKGYKLLQRFYKIKNKGK